MASYPGTIEAFSTLSGTAKLSSPDHTTEHTLERDNIVAIETVLGTTSGTSVLKNISVGEFAVKSAGGTLSAVTVSSGTINNVTMGSPAITGGTIQNLLIGTANITGGTLTNVTGAGGTLSSKIITATRDMTAASGTVAYTGVGFQPTSVIFLGAVSASFSFGVGFADSIKTGAGITSTDGSTIYAISNFAHIATGSGTEQYGSVSSYDADGFSLSWTKAGSPTGTATLKFLCLK